MSPISLYCLVQQSPRDIGCQEKPVPSYTGGRVRLPVKECLNAITKMINAASPLWSVPTVSSVTYLWRAAGKEAIKLELKNTDSDKAHGPGCFAIIT
jgi:hypothetical protein